MQDRRWYPKMVATYPKGMNRDSRPRDNKARVTKSQGAKREEAAREDAKRRDTISQESDLESKLSPLPPKTGRNGDSGQPDTSEPKPQTVAGQEVTATTMETGMDNCHHPPTGAGDSSEAPQLDEEASHAVDVSPDEETDWDEVLAFVAEAAAAEAMRPTVTTAVTAPDARAQDEAATDSTAGRRNTQKLSGSEEDRFLMMLSYGASLRQAAAAVGCHHTTFVRRAKRDKKLAQAIRTAKMQARSEPLLQIYQASRKSWRAAAWLVNHLERREHRGRRK